MKHRASLTAHGKGITWTTQDLIRGAAAFYTVWSGFFPFPFLDIHLKTFVFNYVYAYVGREGLSVFECKCL